MTWPNLFHIRRLYLPILEKIDERRWGDSFKFSFEKFKNEYAGTTDLTPKQAIQYCFDHPDIYVNNLAALKYVSIENERIYEIGSFAYRENGRFSKWQTHLMLFPHKDGTAIIAHKEINPLHSPILHYFSPGKLHKVKAGIAKANELFELENKPFEHIGQ